MSSFPDELHLRSLSLAELTVRESKRQLYEVTREFRFFSDEQHLTTIVPAGFITDFASIPRAVWNIIDPEDPIIGWPSVVHDYHYTTQHVAREEADRLIREGMGVQGASWFIRNAVYRALRLFGGSHWKEPAD